MFEFYSGLSCRLSVNLFFFFGGGGESDDGNRSFGKIIFSENRAAASLSSHVRAPPVAVVQRIRNKIRVSVFHRRTAVFSLFPARIFGLQRNALRR